MDLHPIRPVEFDWASKGFNRQCNLNGFIPNLTSRIQPVEFDWALITGHIGWKFTEITLYACLVKFGGHNLNGFTPNSTGNLTGH